MLTYVRASSAYVSNGSERPYKRLKLFSYLCGMIDERANDLFWSQMAFLKEENASQRKQIEQLLMRLENERKPLEEQIRQLLNTINELTERITESNQNTRLLQITLDHLNQVILSTLKCCSKR